MHQVDVPTNRESQEHAVTFVASQSSPASHASAQQQSPKAQPLHLTPSPASKSKSMPIYCPSAPRSNHGAGTFVLPIRQEPTFFQMSSSPLTRHVVHASSSTDENRKSDVHEVQNLYMYGSVTRKSSKVSESFEIEEISNSSTSHVHRSHPSSPPVVALVTKTASASDSRRGSTPSRRPSLRISGDKPCSDSEIEIIDLCDDEEPEREGQAMETRSTQVQCQAQVQVEDEVEHAVVIIDSDENDYDESERKSRFAVSSKNEPQNGPKSLLPRELPISSPIVVSRHLEVAQSVQSDVIVDSSFTFSDLVGDENGKTNVNKDGNLNQNGSLAIADVVTVGNDGHKAIESQTSRFKPIYKKTDLPPMPQFVKWMSSDEEKVEDEEEKNYDPLCQYRPKARKNAPLQPCDLEKERVQISRIARLFANNSVVNTSSRKQQEWLSSSTKNTSDASVTVHVSEPASASASASAPASASTSINDKDDATGSFETQAKLAKRTRSDPEGKLNKARKAKKTKPETLFAQLPQIGNFRYSAKQLQEANKVNRTKDELHAEMNLYVASKPLALLREYQQEIKSSMHEVPSDVPIIYWKRNIKAEYIPEKDYFIPCTPKMVIQRTFVVYYLAHDLIAGLQQGSLKNDITSAIEHMRSFAPIQYHVILMVEGYDQLVGKIKAHRQRQFKSQVLQGMNGTEQTTRKRKETDEQIAKYPDPRQIEKLINHAQLDLKVNIFTVRSREESVNWLNSFTYTIGSSLYDKYERNQNLANLGTVRSGNDTKATFLKSISHFTRMTEAKAEILHESHKSMYSLYTKLRASGTLGKDRLGRNVVPPTVDSAMLNFFTTDDPNKVIT
ncbi:uncharacterized protein LODBEIA_P42920 [Lodderomyces beijingensis]|uniref:ERCC4 domain-containing protein n=1 Tax=Lodderomyces beijingensis TaxID=1775926 RepID=A0ABP0ZQW1_9ASCO